MRRTVNFAARALAVTLAAVGLTVLSPPQATVAADECVTLVSGDPSKVPPPICEDRSGGDQDGFVLMIDEDDEFAPSYANANGNIPYYSGYNWARGLPSIDVHTWYHDPALSYYVRGPVYRVTPTDDVFGVEAPDTRSFATKGRCLDGSVETTFFFTNTADSTKRSLPDVLMPVTNRSGNRSIFHLLYELNIENGETREMTNEINLLPGRYMSAVSYDNGPIKRLGPDFMVKCDGTVRDLPSIPGPRISITQRPGRPQVNVRINHWGELYSDHYRTVNTSPTGQESVKMHRVIAGSPEGFSFRGKYGSRFAVQTRDADGDWQALERFKLRR